MAHRDKYTEKYVRLGMVNHPPRYHARPGPLEGGVDMYPLTAWLALVGSVWALFALAEDHVSPQSRAQITAWYVSNRPG